MKPGNKDLDLKDLEKKIDEMFYLDPNKPDNSNEDDQDIPEIKVLKLDSEPKNETKEAIVPEKVPKETKPKNSISKETDPAIVSDPPINITKDNLDSEDQDGSIDEIVAKESDEVLAVEDQKNKEQKKTKKDKSKNIFKKKWFYVFLLALILVIIFAVPYTRYKFLGLFIKKDIKIEVIDSLTNTPVSDAKLSIDNKSYLTNREGDINLTLGVGYYSLRLTKNYYNSYSSKILIGFGTNQSDKIRLEANGRRISFKVVNAVTGAPIPSVKISSLEVTSFTSNTGLSNLVLPASSKNYNITFTSSGFNNQQGTYNYFPSDPVELVKMIPSGSIYYLDQSNGLINVDGSNLDGTNNKVLLSGTPNMTINTTFLFPSSNFNYLVLVANRTGSTTGLYLIDTKTGSVHEFDFASSDQFINPIGWINNYFLYELSSSSTTTAGSTQIKSYDAQDNQSIVLDQNQTSGSGSNLVYQNFNYFNIINNQLIYSTEWFQLGSSTPLNLSNTLREVSPSGSSKQDIYSVNAQTNAINPIVKYLPNALYFGDYSFQSNQPVIYSYSNGAVNAQSSLGSNVLYNTYPIYHISSNGLLSAWSQNQNGQPTIFWADSNGSNKKQAQIPPGYDLVGWYNNSYIILSKDNKLYIAYYQGEPGNPLEVGPYAGLSINY